MKAQTPRHRRSDLLYGIPKGYQKRIASICNCTPGHVSAVLNGYRSQQTDLAIKIIRLAERALPY